MSCAAEEREEKVGKSVQPNWGRKLRGVFVYP